MNSLEKVIQEKEQDKILLENAIQIQETELQKLKKKIIDNSINKYIRDYEIEEQLENIKQECKILYNETENIRNESFVDIPNFQEDNWLEKILR